MWERRGEYRRVGEKSREVRKRTDVPLQFPARLHVTLAMRTSSLFSVSELLTFINICVLLLHSLVGGRKLNIIVNLLWW
jgi:hypothetical protein